MPLLALKTMTNNFKIPRFFLRDSSEKTKNPILVLRGIAKSYRSEDLFSGVDLTIGSNDRVAIVGANGVGKSAFLKIIIGQEEPDAGNIIRDKNLKIGYLPQETNWESLENTISREIDLLDKPALGTDIHRYKALSRDLLRGFGFSDRDFTRKIITLSGGERTKLALAKILMLKPNLLVLDEPTNHLDLRTIEWLERFLMDWDKTIISVSHDRCFLDKICDKTFELAKSGLEKYYCGYSDYLEEKDSRSAVLEKHYKNQQKYFEKKQEFINRFRYKATKAKGVQSAIKQMDKIEKLERPNSAKEIKVSLGDVGRTCTRVLRIENFAVGDCQFPLFEIKDRVEIDWGDKIGIIGDNGAGKSSLLKSIISESQKDYGKVKTGPGIRIGYYAQAHEDLDPRNTILEEAGSDTITEEGKIRNVLGSLLFSQNRTSKKIEQLSGGERARVALAKLILKESNLLVLDEPTNHLDIMTKEAVANTLEQYNGSLLLVSHDRYILGKVCNKIWEIKNRALRQYLGGYDDYLYQKNQG